MLVKRYSVLSWGINWNICTLNSKFYLWCLCRYTDPGVPDWHYAVDTCDKNIYCSPMIPPTFPSCLSVRQGMWLVPANGLWVEMTVSNLRPQQRKRKVSSPCPFFPHGNNGSPLVSHVTATRCWCVSRAVSMWSEPPTDLQWTLNVSKWET